MKLRGCGYRDRGSGRLWPARMAQRHRQRHVNAGTVMHNGMPDVATVIAVIAALGSACCFALAAVVRHGVARGAGGTALSPACCCGWSATRGGWPPVL